MRKTYALFVMVRRALKICDLRYVGMEKLRREFIFLKISKFSNAL